MLHRLVLQLSIRAYLLGKLHVVQAGEYPALGERPIAGDLGQFAPQRACLLCAYRVRAARRLQRVAGRFPPPAVGAGRDQAFDVFGEVRGGALDRRHRVVQLVGNACGEFAEGGEARLAHQLAARCFQVVQRRGQACALVFELRGEFVLLDLDVLGAAQAAVVGTHEEDIEQARKLRLLADEVVHLLGGQLDCDHLGGGTRSEEADPVARKRE